MQYMVNYNKEWDNMFSCFVEKIELTSKKSKDLMYLSACKVPKSSQIEASIIPFFDAGELEFIKNIKYDKKRYDFILSRLSAKLAVSKWDPGQCINKIQISNGYFSQPLIKCNNLSNNSLSITHCDDIGITVTFPSDYLVGIDIEKVQDRVLRALKNQLTNRETELLLENFSNRIHAATIFWTAKEALSKALRIGFTSALGTFEIESIIHDKNLFICRFKHFPQFCAYCVSIAEYIFTIVIPVNIQPIPINNALYHALLKLINH